MQMLLELPEALSEFLSASGQDPSRAALEAIALEAYREDKLSTGELRHLLGYHTRLQVHARSSKTTAFTCNTTWQIWSTRGI